MQKKGDAIHFICKTYWTWKSLASIKTNDILMSEIIMKASWFTKHFLEIKTSGLNLNTHRERERYSQWVSVRHMFAWWCSRTIKNSASHHFHRVYRAALHRWLHFSHFVSSWKWKTFHDIQLWMLRCGFCVKGSGFSLSLILVAFSRWKCF